MKRRRFLYGAAAIGTAGLTVQGLDGKTTTDSPLFDQTPDNGTDHHLAGYTLQQIRDQYHRDLFIDWLPFMERHVIDPEYGGFLCNTDFDGTRVNADKNPLFEGRGVWIYSCLYTHFGRDLRYLEVARRSVELLSKSQPPDEVLWCTRIQRDGTPATPPGTVIPTDLGIAEGFAAYAQATGKEEYLNRAKRLLHKCVQAYDQPDYDSAVGQVYLGESAPALPGARIMGSWMVLLRTISQILEIDADPQVEHLADRCIHAVIDCHYNPKFQLNNELLHHDLSRPAGEYSQLCNLGNTLEITWMLLDDALRRHDHSMFVTCTERFQRHAAVASDVVYDGVFHSLLNVDENRFLLNKLLWAQEELLTDALYIYQQSGASWARDLFSRMYRYVREKYPLTSHGSPLWMYETGRQATFEEFAALPKRIENYHHPRHLMLSLRRIDRMIVDTRQRT